MTARGAKTCSLLLGLAVLLGSVPPGHAQNGVASSALDQKSVLVLFATGRTAQISLTAENELPRLLSLGLGRQVDYHSEYLDTGGFPETERYEAAFREFLRAKYAERRLDLIIAMHEVVIEFLAMHGGGLFPGTPVVFYSATKVDRPSSHSTGIVGEVDFTRTVRLATTLQPDTTQVFVVSGASQSDQEMEDLARGQLESLDGRLRITYLSGLPTATLERQLAALPSRAIVYYLLVYQDGLGENFNPLAYLERIARVANRPIYSWVDSTIGRGVVGGSMQDQRARVEALAALALRVLRNEAPASIAVSSPNLTVNKVDWRQLRRWGISEARIPAGTAVLFQERGVWEQYRSYILAAGTLMLAQGVLIAGLLIQAARRRKAEEQLRHNQTELRASYDRVRDLGSRMLNAQEIERSRIARELHDDIAQQTALVALNLQMLHEMGPGCDSRKLVEEALEHTQTIARSLHELSHRLHPAKLQLMGLVGALNGLRRDLLQAGIAIKFSDRKVPSDLPHDVSLSFYRIAQEALQNALRHGGARHISMALTCVENELTLIVADDGAGFDVDSAFSAGLGLIGMRERLEPFDGRLKIDSRAGLGTSVEATVRLSRPDSA